MGRVATGPGAEIRADLATSLELLGNRYVMAILWALFHEDGPVTFTGLRTMTEVNPGTLSARLRQLEREGMVKRTPLNVLPRRVEYTLTEKARAMSPVWREFLRWQVKFPRTPRTGRGKERPLAAARSA